MLGYVSLFLIFFAVLVIIIGIVVVHEIPGKIAVKRNHPQVDAIKITSYLGLIVFPLWMLALIWAHIQPWKITGFDSQEGHSEGAPEASLDGK